VSSADSQMSWIHIPLCRTREALWASFQASVDDPQIKLKEEPRKLVKIEKRYLFAGEETVCVQPGFMLRLFILKLEKW
jgi:hypothetical protein